MLINMINKIAIISASGIGNTILFTPTLLAIRQQFPKAIIHMIVTNEVFGECVRGSGLIDEILVIPKNMFGIIKFIMAVRKQYDASITVFPSNKWQFNLFAYFIGASRRITHSYEFGKIRTLSFIQNTKIAADPSLHDVYQNYNLLKGLSLESYESIPDLLFYLSNEDMGFADRYFEQNNISTSDFVIGVHSGAGPIGEKKKWGINNFAEEIKQNINEKHSAVILFGGKEETDEREQLRDKLKSENVLIFNGTLKQTAALIRKCDYFLSNDTGLMHIAACFGIKQKSIFVSTNPIRTSPLNNNAIVQIEGECNKYLYPFWSTK